MTSTRPQTRYASKLGIVGAVALGAVALPVGCDRSDSTPRIGPVGAEGWLAGDLQAQMETVAEHLGGMGDAMMKIGDRYIELHWAGENRNWAMAAHQIEEIEETFELALARRPKYDVPMGEAFIKVAIPGLVEAIDAEDLALFRERFAEMTVNCNACHMATDHAFVRISVPRQPSKPWHWPTE